MSELPFFKDKEKGKTNFPYFCGILKHIHNRIQILEVETYKLAPYLCPHEGTCKGG